MITKDALDGIKVENVPQTIMEGLELVIKEGRTLQDVSEQMHRFSKELLFMKLSLFRKSVCRRMTFTTLWYVTSYMLFLGTLFGNLA